MAREHGFKFKISGEVFIAQKSRAGADVVAAHTEAVEARHKIQGALMDVPAEFTISEPAAASRRAPDLLTKVGKDGEVPASDELQGEVSAAAFP